jgi:hypothetical protein
MEARGGATPATTTLIARSEEAEGLAGRAFSSAEVA